MNVTLYTNVYAVSEPIGLEIVALNGGSYTGAILFTGWMYIGAAVFLWLVRAWQIGEIEEKAAASAENEGGVDLVSSSNPTLAENTAPVKFRRSPFMKRIFMWQKV